MQADAVSNDINILQKLNQDYIRSVQHSDVCRFDEILANDFLNSNPDGSILDRAGGWKSSGLGVEETFDELLSYTQLKNMHIRW